MENIDGGMNWQNTKAVARKGLDVSVGLGRLVETWVDVPDGSQLRILVIVVFYDTTESLRNLIINAERSKIAFQRR